MTTQDENFLKFPLTTNRLDVVVDKKAFFEKYTIVCYSSNDKEYKNLAYEQLGNVPTISVTGIRARWIENCKPFTQFFILSTKEKANDILESLRSYEQIKSKIDNLELYNNTLQKRIIASLAINSLGKKRNDKLMYNDGSLLVRDDTNFGIRPSKQDLVCLKMEINEYMNLTAKTASFTHPFNTKELAKHKNCVFHEGKYIDGCLWSGEALKPIIIDTKKLDSYDLKQLYIKKRKRANSITVVPYWPFNQEKYMHGKLFAITQVVDSVNEAYKDILTLNFHDYPVWKYDEYLSGDYVMSLIKEQLKDNTIIFDDPFKTEGSKALISHLKEEFTTLMEGHIGFSVTGKGGELIIKLCEPIDDELQETHYSKSMDRMYNSANVLQHVIYDENDSKDSITKASARRILMELMVKKFIVSGAIPSTLKESIKDWEFIQYRLRAGMVHGASMTTDSACRLNITPIGMNGIIGEGFDSFVSNRLKYSHSEKIQGSKDYRVLKKGNNTYLIIDTDEIPILDAKLIDDGYVECINDGVTISKFKRKDNMHLYLRGYLGFHMWLSEGLDDQNKTSYSYVCGKNKQKIQIKKGDKMDKMPRARRIFVLHADNPETIETDIEEIASMLKQGFGRWDEFMTYPFPFKILYEYLDDLMEQVHGIHWSKAGTKDDPLCQ